MRGVSLDRLRSLWNSSHSSRRQLAGQHSRLMSAGNASTTNDASHAKHSKQLATNSSNTKTKSGGSRFRRTHRDHHERRPRRPPNGRVVHLRHGAADQLLPQPATDKGLSARRHQSRRTSAPLPYNNESIERVTFHQNCGTDQHTKSKTSCASTKSTSPANNSSRGNHSGPNPAPVNTCVNIYRRRKAKKKPPGLATERRQERASW